MCRTSLWGTSGISVLVLLRPGPFHVFAWCESENFSSLGQSSSRTTREQEFVTLLRVRWNTAGAGIVGAEGDSFSKGFLRVAHYVSP